MTGCEAYLCVRVYLVMLCTCRLHLVTIVNRFAPSELFVGVKLIMQGGDKDYSQHMYDGEALASCHMHARRVFIQACV